ncbi:MAG: histidine phosphatase family protein [Bacteroidota bacterium]
MKRNLVLIRHTKASQGDFSLDDFERPLKKDRIDDAKNMANKLSGLGLHPDLIICSPALRTKQTAEHFCDKLKYDYSRIQFERSLYESSEAEIMEAVHSTDAEVRTLTIIAHNPSLTYFANIFLSSKIEQIPTTGVVWMEFDNSDWKILPSTPAKLKYFLTPKTI